MKYIKLSGKVMAKDAEEIKKALAADLGAVFVYVGEDRLSNYIRDLHIPENRLLGERELYRFKVCYEKTDLNVSYSSKSREKTLAIRSMSDLIDALDPKDACRIVIESNDRVELAFIVQQLIFIKYPLETVDILLKKEERDQEKVRRFMKNIYELMQGCKSASERLKALRLIVNNEPDGDATKTDRLKDIDDSLASCESIGKNLLKASNVELKFAAAASKKAGKSVIINCFLGEEIAPTSLMLPTPNNCIYKKSPDRKYHLRIDSEGEKTQDFDTRREIHNAISKYFNDAADNEAQGFTMPDMNIEYVTDENNFSAYTIYDTPGPDAAFAGHREPAEKAIRQCDVAVFAIDYTKYLTDPEAKYLEEIRKIFKSQNKFHSLIFALNKVDEKYNDQDPPTNIEQVDFIRTKLCSLSEEYNDSIIFPTSALECFCAINAEKSGVAKELENEISIAQMKEIAFGHRDVPTLKFLHGLAENLEYYNGFNTVSYNSFKEDSGMTALMKHVSYVAQSKARDEIVNNVTYEIDVQRIKLMAVFNEIKNLEAIINADDRKITEISHIISDYTDAVQNILNSKFTEDDLSQLPSNALLRLKGNPNGDYAEVIAYQKKAVAAYCEPMPVADAMYKDAVIKIWQNLNSHLGNLDGYAVDRLFTREDFKNIANKAAKTISDKSGKDTYDTLSKLRDEVKLIVEHRQALLKQESDACRGRLEKENISIFLPSLPEFEFAAQLTLPNEFVVDVGSLNFSLYDKISGAFKTKFWPNILKRLKKHPDKNDFKLKLDADRLEFQKECDENLKDSFKLSVIENNVSEKMAQSISECVIEGYMKELTDELDNCFTSMNDTYMACIQTFRAAVDDRDKYKSEIELLNRRKENIEDIFNALGQFMSAWNVVVNNFEEAPEEEAEKTAVTV